MRGKTRILVGCIAASAVWLVVSCLVPGCTSKSRVEESVVKLIIHKEFDGEEPLDCKGTGTIVHTTKDRQGFILTNRHVVERLYTGDNITVQWKDGRSMQAQLYTFDDHLDLAAFLTLGALPLEAGQLYFAEPSEISEAVRGAATVRVYGFPANIHTLALHNGEIHSRSGNTINFKLAGDITLDEGESGSPLLNAKDRIVGVFFGNEQDIHRAIHADIVRTVVEGWGIGLNPPPRHGPWCIATGMVSFGAALTAGYGAGDSFQSAREASDRKKESRTYEESQKWDRQLKKKLVYGSLYTVGAIAAAIVGYQFVTYGEPPESGAPASTSSLNIGGESENWQIGLKTGGCF